MNPNLMINVLAFAILTVLWLAFGFGLLFKREMVDETWRSFRSWPLLVKLTAALLILPLVLGLWIWNSKWPVWLRLVLVAGLAWGTEVMFFPTSVIF